LSAISAVDLAVSGWSRIGHYAMRFACTEMPTEPGKKMRCPTCGVEQEWADSCRRCRCDLRLLRAAEEAYWRHRRECLGALENGRIEVALAHARKSHELFPHAESHRLMAVCELMSERWQEALREARLAGDEHLPSAE
jgi:hypothetical protein